MFKSGELGVKKGSDAAGNAENIIMGSSNKKKARSHKNLSDKPAVENQSKKRVFYMDNLSLKKLAVDLIAALHKQERKNSWNRGGWVPWERLAKKIRTQILNKGGRPGSLKNIADRVRRLVLVADRADASIVEGEVAEFFFQHCRVHNPAFRARTSLGPKFERCPVGRVGARVRRTSAGPGCSPRPVRDRGRRRQRRFNGADRHTYRQGAGFPRSKSAAPSPLARVGGGHRYQNARTRRRRSLPALLLRDGLRLRSQPRSALPQIA